DVEGRRDHAERRAAGLSSGRGELRPVEGIESLDTELRFGAFVNLPVLEQREIEIVDAVAAQIGWGAGAVAVRERGWDRERADVEGAIEMVLEASAGLSTGGDAIRPRRAG